MQENKNYASEIYSEECKTYEILYNKFTKIKRTAKEIYEFKQAFDFAERVHRNQKRKSGQPYIIHPMSVALFLSEWNMDTNTIIVGLLHDVLEDAPVTVLEIEQKFGHKIAQLTESVTKVPYFKSSNILDLKNRYFDKMIQYAKQEPKVLIIKLADRLHNFLTLKHMKEEQQQKTARETFLFFSSIAKCLGMNELNNFLVEESMKILFPDEYKFFVEKIQINQLYDFNDKLIKEFKNIFKDYVPQPYYYIDFKKPILFDAYLDICINEKDLREFIEKWFTIYIYTNTPQETTFIGKVLSEGFSITSLNGEDYVFKTDDDVLSEDELNKNNECDCCNELDQIAKCECENCGHIKNGINALSHLTFKIVHNKPYVKNDSLKENDITNFSVEKLLFEIEEKQKIFDIIIEKNIENVEGERE